MRHVSKTYSTVVYVAIHHTRVARSDPACVHVVHSVGGTAARGSVRSINCVEGSHGPKGFEKYVSDLLVIMPVPPLLRRPHGNASARQGSVQACRACVFAHVAVPSETLVFVLW